MSAPAAKLELKSLNGFGNSFASEAEKGALPVGRNSPQRPTKGLYPEVLSARRSPRRCEKTTVAGSTAGGRRPRTDLMSASRKGCCARDRSTKSKRRPTACAGIPIPTKATDFLDGLATLAGSGDLATQTGIAVHIYCANRSMSARYFWNADGELMLVPQQGSLLIFTEFGKLEVSPGEIAVVPRGMRFKVELLASQARGYVCENYGAMFRLHELGPIGSQGLAQERDFLAPVAALEERDAKCKLVVKFMGGLWATELDHSPLDVVAWHGDYVPYKYDLARFMVINTVSFDHADPSSLRLPARRASRTALHHLPAALDGRRGHVPAALVSPQRDERADGPGARRLRREGRGLPARRRVAPQLHVGARAGSRDLRESERRAAQAPEDREHPRLHVGVALRVPAHQVREKDYNKVWSGFN
jgi:homogentisate 1,2-dioxygenase